MGRYSRGDVFEGFRRFEFLEGYWRIWKVKSKGVIRLDGYIIKFILILGCGGSW